jgi:hypothetical protein
MKRMTQRTAVLGFTLMLALASVAMSAPKASRPSKYLTIEGRVLQVNQTARTLIVSDFWSKKLYLVNVPKGETFKITFGMNQRIAEPELREVHRNDRVRMRCIRTDNQHLARLDDGREVVVLTATR